MKPTSNFLTATSTMWNIRGRRTASGGPMTHVLHHYLALERDGVGKSPPTVCTRPILGTVTAKHMQIHTGSINY